MFNASKEEKKKKKKPAANDVAKVRLLCFCVFEEENILDIVRKWRHSKQYFKEIIADKSG